MKRKQTAICNNMDDSHKFQQKKPDSKSTYYESIYTKLKWQLKPDWSFIRILMNFREAQA